MTPMGAVSVSILALTIFFSLARPKMGRLRIGHATAAAAGAVACVLSGLLPVRPLINAVDIIYQPVLTILSLMVITRVAEGAGVFTGLTLWIVRGARGDGRKLFTRLFFAGAVASAFFTNDVAILVFTPLVIRIVGAVQEPGWEDGNRQCYYFAIFYVANVAGLLIISNPINLILCRMFDIDFVHYACWMALPSVVTVLASYAGLRLWFRGRIPAAFRPLKQGFGGQGGTWLRTAGSAVILLTLASFILAPKFGIPFWTIAVASAALMLVLNAASNRKDLSWVARGVGWDGITFIAGIFLIASAMRHTGATGWFARGLAGGAEWNFFGLSQFIGLLSGGLSALINNHPATDIMGMVLQQMESKGAEGWILAFASLIGGTVGPKMLPIGSLAALLWYRMLRENGIQIPYWTYVKIGIPVSLASIVLGVAVLYVEARLSGLIL